MLFKQLKFCKSVMATEYCYITFSMYMRKFTYLLHSCPSYVREDNSFPLKDGGMTCAALLSNRPLTETLVVWGQDSPESAI
jgi:hypothetical protein